MVMQCYHGNITMRSSNLYNLLAISILLVILSFTYGFKVLQDAENSIEQRVYEDSYAHNNEEYRMKRQLENLEDDYPAASNQDTEEPGFWDRIVRVAVKLFSRFVEWLNSS